MEPKRFYQKLDSIMDIPTLPSIVMKVNKMLQDSETSIEKLSKIIETDQVMVAKILRLVNSTFYGFRSKIKNIKHAIIVLGFNNIRNAIMSVSIIQLFSEKNTSEGFDISDFWKHAIAVAVTSKYLSEKSGLDSPDNCFVAGILHDIGKVVLSLYFQELFEKVWKSIKEDKLSFYEAENKSLSVNHAQIGGHLAKNWQFPDTLIETITYHHSIDKNVLNLDQLMIIHTANYIVNNCEGDSERPPDFSSIDPEVKRIMFSQLQTISDWLPDVTTEIESAWEFFLQGD